MQRRTLRPAKHSRGPGDSKQVSLDEVLAGKKKLSRETK
jgi:hypothetical protein